MKLIDKHYNRFNEIPYLTGGEDISASYVDDIQQLKDQVTTQDRYLDSSKVQDSLEDYYAGEYTSADLGDLQKYISRAYVENEKLTKAELRNKMNYAVKTENLYKNIKNSKLYNSALQKMVNEDIALDEKETDKIRTSLENKARNLEIRQYYDDKMKYQTQIVKIVIIICLIMLGLSFMYKINILNTNIYIALIGLSLACIVIFTIGKLIDILMRDNYKFHEYGYVRSHHYLNKGERRLRDNDIPLHQQKDLISNKCLRVLEDE
tara:strand:+ start:179 stop:970 length:792 start_codon:yes stop_codon:yes gene_type:complete